MTGFFFKTVLFYAAYLCLAASAAPAVTTLSPDPISTTEPSVDLETTTDAAGSGTILTTVAPELDAPVVPPFQCTTPQSESDYHKSVSSLYTGFRLATGYVNDQVLTPGECSPVGASLSIFHRVGAETSTFSLNQGFAIFQAYSKIAHFASETDTADQTKMQIIHELLNSLITNYYEVVSPDHCSCGSASSDSCITIPSIDFLELETYPDSCTPAAYLSTNLVAEFQRVLLKFVTSPLLRDNYSSNLTSCQQWKEEYLPTGSSAEFALHC